MPSASVPLVQLLAQSKHSVPATLGGQQASSALLSDMDFDTYLTQQPAPKVLHLKSRTQAATEKCRPPAAETRRKSIGSGLMFLQSTAGKLPAPKTATSYCN
ncbi:unnamed protein product [Eretmochelys imbricata]